MADIQSDIADLIQSIEDYDGSKLNTRKGLASGLKYTLKTFTVTSGAVECDLSEAQVYLIEPTGDITFSFINIPDTNEYITSIFRIKNGGLHLITWPVNSLFENGTPPTLAPDKEDIISIQYDGQSENYWITNIKSDWEGI